MATSQSTKFAAFQFYPRDFLTSSKVARMSLTEVGIYITLLSYAWLDRGLPTKPEEIAKLVRMPTGRFKRLWSGVLSECFVVRGSKLVNQRQERQRKELEDYVSACRDGGKKSAQKRTELYGSSQPPSKVLPKVLPASLEGGPNSSSASSSTSSEGEKPRPRPMAPIHNQRAHLRHVVCGKVCLHEAQFDEFSRRRNGERETVRKWAEGVIDAWTNGAHAEDEPGDAFDFWRARYDEQWPATVLAKPKTVVPDSYVSWDQHPSNPHRATGTAGSR